MGSRRGRSRPREASSLPEDSQALVSKRRGEAAREDLKTQRPPGSDWWREARRSPALGHKRDACLAQRKRGRPGGIVEGRPSHTPKLNSSNNNKNSNRSSSSNHFAGSPQTLPHVRRGGGRRLFSAVNLAAEANGGECSFPLAKGRVCKSWRSGGPPSETPLRRSPPCSVSHAGRRVERRLAFPPNVSHGRRGGRALLFSPGQGLGWAGGQPRGCGELSGCASRAAAGRGAALNFRPSCLSAGLGRAGWPSNRAGGKPPRRQSCVNAGAGQGRRSLFPERRKAEAGLRSSGFGSERCIASPHCCFKPKPK